jgi:hypothetical protein
LSNEEFSETVTDPQDSDQSVSMTGISENRIERFP